MTPLARASLLALASAVAFGLTVPIVRRYGASVGTFTTAALLYLGAAAATAWPSRRGGGLRRSDLKNLIPAALLGASAAPALLAWGLQRTDGTTAALLLNLEAAFTVVLARAVYREHIGGRVWLALAIMLGAGALLVGRAPGASGSVAGAVAICLAVLCWALDNTVTRPLADRDPATVVRGKAALGAALTLGAAVAAGESAPAVVPALVLLACGATGYGLSLRLYLLAQRRMGVARTGSVFALAPFIGAAAAWALGDGAVSPGLLVAGVLFGVGAYLHATERHDHPHQHHPIEHDHAHRHDDGHHRHEHDAIPAGEHSHPHRHGSLVHSHPHGEDVHHRHDHD